MPTARPLRAPRPSHRLLGALLPLTIALVAACGGAPSATPPPDGASPLTSPTPTPTDRLFGQPPPVDPCSLVERSEAATVLDQPVAVSRQETSGGAASSCLYETEDPLTRVAVTVIKEPRSLRSFVARRESFGPAARPVDDLGDGAYTVAFSQVVTAYVLEGDVEFYVDVARSDRLGRDMRERALALAERALSRFPG